jgi:hypothetical protein
MLSRRSLLVGTAGGLLVTGAGRRTALAAGATPEASGTPSVPETLSHQRQVTGGGARVDAPALSVPLTHLAVSWVGPEDAARVRLHTAAGPQEWQRLHTCTAGRDGRRAPCSAVVPAAGAVGYDLQVPDGATVTEMNTVDGPSRTRAAAPLSELRLLRRAIGCRYLTRAAWGADEKLRFTDDLAERYPIETFPVQTLTVHHTVTRNDDPDPRATMRAIYRDQTITRDFGDIGYHLLIDAAGHVYEGRFTGTDPFPVFTSEPGPDGRPLMVNAAHVAGFNAGNVGVALLGDFTDRQPTAAARASLVRVLAGLADAAGLDPLGTAAYVNPVSSAGATVDVIAAHRDWRATECPGDAFAPTLPQVRQDVAELLRTTRPGPPRRSP